MRICDEMPIMLGTSYPDTQCTYSIYANASRMVYNTVWFVRLTLEAMDSVSVMARDIYAKLHGGFKTYSVDKIA